MATEEYWGGHRPPEDEATLDDMGDWGGGDAYEHPEFYSHTGGGEPWEKETFRVLRSVRGKPDALVTIYRALPPGHTTIEPGDWVALSRGYCAQHAMQDDDAANDWPIIAAQVPAHTVRNGGNDVIEWGYHGPPVQARLASLHPGGRTAALTPYDPNQVLYRGMVVSEADLADLVANRVPAGRFWSSDPEPTDTYSRPDVADRLRPGLFPVRLTGIPKSPPKFMPNLDQYEWAWEASDQVHVTGAEVWRDGAWQPVQAASTASVTASQGSDYSQHAMVALRPSEGLRKRLADLEECTEGVDELHLTLRYLGEIDPGDLRTQDRYYRALYDFALHSGFTRLTGTLNGYGVFMNGGDEGNVLLGLWDIPEIAEFRASLTGYLKAHAPDLREDNHGFTPHTTLTYSDQPIKQLPSLPDGDLEETFGSVWLVWGTEWTEVTLS